MNDYVKEMRKLIGSRPLLVVGATVVVMNKKNEILLQQRSDNRKWGFPGGVMEYGESLEETANRELYEETGLMANDLELIEVLSGEKECHKYPNGHEIFGITAIFTTSNISGTLSINDDESVNINFFSLDNLPTNLIDKARYIIEKHLL